MLHRFAFTPRLGPSSLDTKLCLETWLQLLPSDKVPFWLGILSGIWKSKKATPGERLLPCFAGVAFLIVGAWQVWLLHCPRLLTMSSLFSSSEPG